MCAFLVWFRAGLPKPYPGVTKPYPVSTKPYPMYTKPYPVVQKRLLPLYDFLLLFVTRLRFFVTLCTDRSYPQYKHCYPPFKCSGPPLHFVQALETRTYLLLTQSYPVAHPHTNPSNQV